MTKTEQRLSVEEVLQREDEREAIAKVEDAVGDLGHIISNVAEEMEYQKDEWYDFQNMVDSQVNGLYPSDYSTYNIDNIQ